MQDVQKSLQLLEQLTTLPGAPGYEHRVIQFIKDYLKGIIDVTTDPMGNVFIGLEKRDPNKKTIMIDAHSDEVAFMVQYINKNGTIQFIPLGGWIASNVAAQRVQILNSEGEYVQGVVAAKPKHFVSEAEKNTAPSIESMVIDVGTTSYEDTTKLLKIEIGAPIVPYTPFYYNAHTEMIFAKALDNRLGCGIVLELMAQFASKDLPLNLVGVISTQEEMGLRGAKVTTARVCPDIAIAFESTPSDDFFTDDFIKQGGVKRGPQIRHIDTSNISNPQYVKWVVQLAKKHEIPLQRAVRSSGGNNAGSIHLSGIGVPTIAIAVPSRYIHSHNSLACISDYMHTKNLGAKVIENVNDNFLKELATF